MLEKVVNFFSHLNLSQRFMLASFLILILGTLGIGAWIGRQIELGVIHRTGATTALYVDSAVAPLLQELGESDVLSAENVARLGNILQDTPLGQQIVAFRVWLPTGRVVYSNEQEIIGKFFPMSEGLLLAGQGTISSEISGLQDEENVTQRAAHSELLETYSPVYLSETNRVIAIAEFYQIVDDLNREVAIAQRWSWLVVGGSMLMIYFLLAFFVRQASDTIDMQQVELNWQVRRLTDLLAQNNELHERVKRAAASVTTLNERFLRRVGAELHDGPAQELGFILLKLDALIGRLEEHRQAPDDPALVEQLSVIQNSLQTALKEIRGVATGLSLPQLADLNMVETVIRAVRSHERRTNTKVKLDLGEIPEDAPLPVKITVYRLIQEGMTNAYRHAGGAAQRVYVCREADSLHIEVSDQGEGFDQDTAFDLQGHLGLAGMRERVESLGGSFRLESEAGKGTKVIADLPLKGVQDSVD